MWRCAGKLGAKVRFGKQRRTLAQPLVAPAGRPVQDQQDIMEEGEFSPAAA